MCSFFIIRVKCESHPSKVPARSAPAKEGRRVFQELAHELCGMCALLGCFELVLDAPQAFQQRLEFRKILGRQLALRPE